MWALLAAILVLAASAARAQEAVSPQKAAELRQLRESLYPDFLSGTESSRPTLDPIEPPATPTPAEAPAEPAEEAARLVTERLDRRPQVLAADLSSTTTWLETCARLPKRLEDLRLALLVEASDPEVAAAQDALMIDAERLVEMSATFAPTVVDGARWYAERLARQTELMIRDYRAEDARRALNTDAMADRTVAQLLALLARGSAPAATTGPAASLLAGWDPGEFRVPGLAARLKGYSRAELFDEYEQRLEAIARGVVGQRVLLYRSLAVEMGEVARELATRADDLDPLSQRPFVNAALRLDVMAENLHDNLDDRTRAHARRQIAAITEALRDARRLTQSPPQ